jgi:hypothetical protein
MRREVTVNANYTVVALGKVMMLLKKKRPETVKRTGFSVGTKSLPNR